MARERRGSNRWRRLPATVSGFGNPALLVAVILAASCGRADPPASTARDSAGIRVVENARPSGPATLLDSVPAFDIGPASGPESEFANSPVSAIRLDDGRIVATAWATTEVRVFDWTGRWIRTVGRQGGGPGEFEALGLVFRAPGDSVVTFEPMTQRVQLWTPKLEFVRLAPLLSPAGRSIGFMTGVLADGSFLLSSSLPDQAGNTDLTTRNRVSYFRARSPDGAWDSLFSFPARPRIRHPANPTWSLGNPLFAPDPAVHQRGGLIAFTPGDRFEVQVRSTDGRLGLIVRRPAAPRLVSAAEFDRAVDHAVEGLQSPLREQMIPRIRAASRSRVRPAVADVRIAGDGRIWVLFGDPNIGERRGASIFDTTGRWEADVTLPSGIEVNQIDADGLLGTFKDGEGFNHLRFFRYHRLQR